jgi:hypothetical protein
VKGIQGGNLERSAWFLSWSESIPADANTNVRWHCCCPRGFELASVKAQAGRGGHRTSRLAML